LADLLKAIERYKKNITEEKTDPNFVKYFDTFMGEWRDFLEPDYGEVEALIESPDNRDLSHLGFETGGAS
jgi:hypothetical protein